MSCPLGGLRGPLPPSWNGPATAMSKEQLLQLACAIARVGALICDVGKVGTEKRYGLLDEEPYIWDIKEE